MSYGTPGLKDVATAFRLSQRYRTSILQTCLSHAGIREPLTKVPNVYLRCAFYRIEGALSIACAPIYRLSRIVGIPRLRCAFYRLRKSTESAEHIYQCYQTLSASRLLFNQVCAYVYKDINRKVDWHTLALLERHAFCATLAASTAISASL